MLSLLILFCLFVWAVRSLLMDVTKNLQDVYAKWENRGKEQMLSTLSVNGGIKRVAPPHRSHPMNNRGGSQVSRPRQWLNRGNTKLKSQFNQLQEKYGTTGLASFKSQPIVMPENVLLRPFVGSCCSRCLPISRLAFHDEITQTLGIKDVLKLHTESRSNSFLVRIFNYLTYFLQRRPKHHYADVTNNVLANHRLEEAVQKTLEQEFGDKLHSEGDDIAAQVKAARKKHWKRALLILELMKSTISGFMLKIAAWVFSKFLRRILSGIFVHNGQIEALKKASRNNIPMIYLPLHRSHLDYILVTLILYLHDLRAPLVAAGNNLMIPIFGNILRTLGAFYIKRKMDPQNGSKDYIYRGVLHAYMTEFLNAGHHLEFFIEGGRSRTGKSCMPKGGLLSIVVDTLREGHVEDVYIVPVAINYEKILEGNFISEQLGKKKVNESFFIAVQSIWTTIHSKFGSVRVDFCQPFSLRELLQASKTFHLPSSQLSLPASPHSPANALRSSFSNGSLVSLNGTSPEDVRKMIKDISEHILYDATKATSLMTTNLLAFLLLTKHRKGAPLHHIAQSMSWLREEVYARGRDVGFTGDSTDAVRHAAGLLGAPLVSMESLHLEWSSHDVHIVFLKPDIHLPHVFELQYYANAVVSVFLHESVIAMALFAVLDEEIEVWKESPNAKITVSRQQLVEAALRLADILQYEFIMAPPCMDLSKLINEAVDSFIAKEILSGENCDEPGIPQDGPWTRQVPRSFEWEDNSEDEMEGPLFKDEMLKINLSEDSINQLQFFRSILGSLVESYWLVACSLHKLIHQEKEESVFFKEIQQTAQDKLHQGLLLFEECFGADALKNTLKLLEHWKVVESYSSGGIRVLYLNPIHDSAEGVQQIISRIEEFKI